MRHLAPLLLALLLGSAAWAQVKGHVLLDDDTPAAYATAMLYADSNTSGTPTAYAITSAKGHFTIQAQRSQGAWLVVRYLGYKEYREPLPTGNKMIEIKLEADVKRLGEVTVEERYKSVEVSGDTIKFNTEYFKTGTEDNAAEVLNKIPGMEVDDNGDVSYGGKKVDRITVDGRDIFSSGSDGALNTLSADAIQGAEVIRNARSNSLIDDFSNRELTTLNLKTDGRMRLSGKLSAMGGIREKGKSENSLLLIGKKLSLTSIVSANNTGEAVFSFSDYIRHVVGLDNLLSGRGMRFYFSNDELSLLIPPASVYESAGGIATLSGTWAPSDKLKVKGSLIGNANQMEAESLSQQEYLGLELVNLHRSASSTGNKFFSGYLQETWKPTDHIEFSNSTRLTHTHMQAYDTLAEQGISSVDTWQDNGRSKWGASDEMVLNHKFDNNNLLSAHLLLDYNHRNYSYSLLTNQPLLPASYYGYDGSMYDLDNSRRVVNTTIAPDITYAIKLWHQYTLTTTLAYSHTGTTFDHMPLHGDSLHASLGIDNTSLGITFSKNNGLLRFSVGAEAVADSYRSSISDIDGTHKSALLPKASVGLAFSSTHRIDLTASMSQSNIDLEYLLRSPMVSGYSSIYAGSYIVDPHSRQSNVQLNYSLHDLYSTTTIIARCGISRNRFSLKSHTLQDSTIATQTIYDNDGALQSEYINAHVSKGLGDFPADLNIDGSLTSSSSQTSVNLTGGDLRSVSASAGISLASRSKKALNGNIGFSYSTSASSFSGSSQRSSRMNQYNAHAALQLTLSHVVADVHFALSYADNSFAQRDFGQLGFKVEYRLGRWRFTLRGENVLHTDNMDWLSESATEVLISTTQFRKIPGYIMAGIAYRF